MRIPKFVMTTVFRVTQIVDNESYGLSRGGFRLDIPWALATWDTILNTMGIS